MHPLLVKNILETKKNSATSMTVTLIWDPGHINFEGNKRADELARLGNNLNLNLAEQVRVTFCNLKKQLNLNYKVRWKNLTNCRVAGSTSFLYTTSRKPKPYKNM